MQGGYKKVQEEITNKNQSSQNENSKAGGNYYEVYTAELNNRITQIKSKNLWILYALIAGLSWGLCNYFIGELS